jgi:hypothetical protein
MARFILSRPCRRSVLVSNTRRSVAGISSPRIDSPAVFDAQVAKVGQFASRVPTVRRNSSESRW